MPEYRSPGIFVSQTPSANKAIQPASTSIAGMVGATERGSANVPVRRNLLFIQHSLDSGLQWVGAEANAEQLWEIVRQTVTAFLFGIWRNGGLTGFRIEQAFYVHVDFGISMDQAHMDDGRMIVDAGVALLRPAEFVIIRVSKETTEAAD